MRLMATEWHPWFSYEWWSEIGTGLLGVVAASIVGGVTVWVALRSNRVARETVEFTKRVREEDARRQEREELRHAQLERIGFGGLLRTWVREVEEFERNNGGFDWPPAVQHQRDQIGDLVYDFDQVGRQELLAKLDAILSLNRDTKQDPDMLVWWRAREVKKLKIPLLIQAYVRGDHLPEHGLSADR
ncbi:hypothetical protein [Curtobacterium flaccumfaciens]|uniref:hypothetical protein n=1 Tax=Curtobacterium flaccumfaciens TaxID=2035 RepID=UPI00112E049F|nr:hypothetical protein [Curtobacterium flaccumfaciens]TPG05570.1 hypothetical protein EAH85_12615 [Curtobacterium flaccumfaciens]